MIRVPISQEGSRQELLLFSRLQKTIISGLHYQTAYRFPSNQNQYIDLQTGEARLIGGLPQFITYTMGLNTGTTYDTASLGAACERRPIAYSVSI